MLKPGLIDNLVNFQCIRLDNVRILVGLCARPIPWVLNRKDVHFEVLSELVEEGHRMADVLGVAVEVEQGGRGDVVLFVEVVGQEYEGDSVGVGGGEIREPVHAGIWDHH